MTQKLQIPSTAQTAKPQLTVFSVSPRQLSYLLKFFLNTAWPHPIPVIILIALLDSSKSETSHFTLYLLVVVLYLETCEDSSLESEFLSSLSKDGLHTENVLNETLLRSFH